MACVLLSGAWGVGRVVEGGGRRGESQAVQEAAAKKCLCLGVCRGKGRQGTPNLYSHVGVCRCMACFMGQGANRVEERYHCLSFPFFFSFFFRRVRRDMEMNSQPTTKNVINKNTTSSLKLFFLQGSGERAFLFLFWGHGSKLTTSQQCLNE